LPKINHDLSINFEQLIHVTILKNFWRIGGKGREVHHQISSVAFPHSNCRAEIGVKTAKRLITDNTDPYGELDTNKFQRAILQCRNAPDQDTKLLPAMILDTHPISDVQMAEI